MTPKTGLFCLLLTLALLVPAVHAGSFSHMEITDDDDDASSFGLCPLPTGAATPFLSCPGWDFMFCNVDLHGGYVTDTPDAVLLSIVMRNDAAFTMEALTGCTAFASAPAPAPGTGEFDYHFFVDVGSKTYDASAHLASDGTWTVGGVATAATVVPGTGCPTTACPALTLTVPKAALGVKAGDVLTHLYATSSGTDSQSQSYDVADRAPSAHYGLDYTVANGTGAATTVYTALTGARASVSQAFNAPQDGTYVYNWTSPAGSLAFLYNAQPTAGMLHLRIATATNQTVDAETLDAAATGNKTLSGASGPLTITLQYMGYNGTFTMSLAEAKAPSGTTTTTPTTAAKTTTAAPASTGSTTASSTKASSSSSTTKGAPALGGFAVVGAVALAVLVRRRL